MLLRVPAASLGNLVTYDDRLKKAGVAYFGVATKVSFDTDAAYPKLVFDYDPDSTARLTAENGQQILDMREHESVGRTLSVMSKTEHGGDESMTPAAAPQPAKIAAAPPVQEVETPAPTPVAKPEIVPPSEPVAAVAEVATSDDVDALVSGLLG